MPQGSGMRIAGVIAGAIAVIFGLLTIFSGGQALFGNEAARAAVGAAVPFVLWFNFGAGFAYVVAGVGLLMRARWAATLAALIAGATVLVALAFAVHVFTGGAYEMRTVGAMALRSLVWIVIAVVARRTPLKIG
ncbi:MAG: hypothetical protein ACYC10_03760 [Allorhizobium sp.]